LWPVSQGNLSSLLPLRSSELEHHTHSSSDSRHDQNGFQGNGTDFLNTRHVHSEAARCETDPKISQSQRTRIVASTTCAEKVEGGSVKPVDRLQCDYPECTKTYRRHEHLKRHKQTYVLPSHHPHLRLRH
jgi:hypothetical protein